MCFRGLLLSVYLLHAAELLVLRLQKGPDSFTKPEGVNFDQKVGLVDRGLRGVSPSQPTKGLGERRKLKESFGAFELERTHLQ